MFGPTVLTRTMLLTVLPSCTLGVTYRISSTISRRSVVSAIPLAILLPRRIDAVDELPFTLTLPSGFVRRQQIKATTGTIFVGGNFPRAAIVSVTVWPLDDLLEAEDAARSLPGLPQQKHRSSAVNSLAQIADTPKELAALLLRARDRETSNGVRESKLLDFSLSEGKLHFLFETPLPVADPDELEKQRGVRQLIRRTSAASTLACISGSGDEPSKQVVVSVWGSALVQDWENDLGVPIEASVGSFSWQG